MQAVWFDAVQMASLMDDDQRNSSLGSLLLNAARLPPEALRLITDYVRPSLVYKAGPMAGRPLHKRTNSCRCRYQVQGGPRHDAMWFL